MTLPGIGVFGIDPIIKILVPYLKSLGFRVEALWALTLDDARVCAKELGIPFYTNKVDDVLLKKDVELCLVLCPPNLHSQITVKALGIGKHVLLDRPAGLSQCEALKIVLAAQYYPTLICLLSHGLRFHPAYIQMKKSIDKFVGQPKLIQFKLDSGPLLTTNFNWLCDENMGGGNITLFGSHLIDLITYLTGQRAMRVHGVTRTLTYKTPTINGTRRITSPDYSVIQMEMDGDLLVSITLNNHMQQNYFSQEIILTGTRGYLKAEGSVIKGFVYTTSNTDETSTMNIPKETIIYEDSQDNDFLLIDKNIKNSNTQFSCPLLPSLYMSGLLQLLRSLKEVFNISNAKEWKKESVVGLLGAGFEEGLYIQSVIEAIKKSSRNNQWIKVAILTEEPDPNPTLTEAVRSSTISIYIYYISIRIDAGCQIPIV